jgi:hypothetical protein
MTLDLDQMARQLNGKVVRCNGKLQVLCPGPGHSLQDRSLSVYPEDGAPDGFVAFSHSGNAWQACRDHVKKRLGISSERRSKRVSVSRQPARAEPVSDPERPVRALAIWHEAREPQNTPVQAYFRKRGLDLPEEAAGAVIRYHSTCPFGPKHRGPAMVCLVRDALTDAPKAIHRTALDQSGNKIKIDGSDRLALGPVGGGAIKLTADENVTTCLGIGEGIETTLSLRLLPEFGCSPIWSVISAGGIERFPVLSGVECLWIAVDKDASGRGQRAADVCAERWRDAGREVFLVTPNAERADLNDLVEGRHA